MKHIHDALDKLMIISDQMIGDHGMGVHNMGATCQCILGIWSPAFPWGILPNTDGHKIGISLRYKHICNRCVYIVVRNKLDVSIDHETPKNAV